MTRSICRGALVVVGLGNTHRRDDGVGVRLVEQMKSDSIPNVESLIWGDGDALSIANDLLELSKPVLFVDCARMGLRPGDWRFFDEESVVFRDYSANCSTHGIGMGSALSLARSLGYQHPVRFFGVEPEDVLLDDSLSETLEGELQQLVEALRQSIHDLQLELAGGER